MPFSTGMIDNSPVGGVRPVSTIQIRFANSGVLVDTIEIRGFFFRADNAGKQLFRCSPSLPTREPTRS
jgi:hypothetical protein